MLRAFSRKGDRTAPLCSCDLCAPQVPLLFGCIFTPEFTGGDLGAVVVVAVFWVLSGYVNTCSYLVSAASWRRQSYLSLHRWRIPGDV